MQKDKKGFQPLNFPAESKNGQIDPTYILIFLLIVVVILYILRKLGKI